MDYSFIKSIFSWSGKPITYEISITIGITLLYLWLLLIEKVIIKNKKITILTSTIFVTMTYAISLYYVILLNGIIIPPISVLNWNSLFVFMIITLNIYLSIFVTNTVRCWITKRKFNYSLIRLLFYLTYTTLLIIYYIEKDSLTSQIYIVLVVEATLDIAINMLKKVVKHSKKHPTKENKNNKELALAKTDEINLQTTKTIKKPTNIKEKEQTKTTTIRRVAVAKVEEHNIKQTRTTAIKRPTSAKVDAEPIKHTRTTAIKKPNNSTKTRENKINQTKTTTLSKTSERSIDDVNKTIVQKVEKPKRKKPRKKSTRDKKGIMYNKLFHNQGYTDWDLLSHLKEKARNK